MKRKNSVFYVLEKNLKQIQNNSKVSYYERWTKSKGTIDQFYDKNGVTSDDLYVRLLGLKKKKERNALITIPVFITVFFGVFVTLGLDVMKNYFAMWKDFLVQMSDKLELAEQKFGEMQELVTRHDEIVEKTSRELLLISCVLILLLLALAFLVAGLFYFYHNSNFLYFEVCNFEINKIESILDRIEEADVTETKAFLNLENSKYVLKYELVDVAEKIADVAK